MGILTTFFAAPTEELQSKKLSEGIPAAFPSVQCNYIDEMKVASLESILTGRDPSDAMRALINQCVYSDDASGITVLRLGDDLVKALSVQTPDSATEPAKKWLASGQWGGFGRRAGDLRELVDMMVTIGKLASAALAPTHGLFLWVCP